MDRAGLRAVLRATQCTEERGEFVFLRDPKQAAAHRAVVDVGVSVGGNPQSEVAGGWLGIATGGTSGGVKYARHDEATLGAAVQGLQAHFGLGRVNAIDVLPPYHVSGFMARVRAAATGGEHVAWTWKRLEAGERPRLPKREDGWVVSLVPTQLQRLIALPAAVEWLRELRIIFLGGGPIWPELADRAADAGLPLALTYGMTETAAMVAALRPEEFLAGARTCGAALPHARLTTDPEGVVCVTGASVFRGYWPEWRETREFATEDLGSLDAQGHLRVDGRRDAVIITGGKKVHPEEVEAALRTNGDFSDVAVVGVPDAEWGEIVVACFPAGAGAGADHGCAAAGLAPFQRPKRYLAVEEWPRNAQGKINRAGLRALAKAQIGG
jgi:O-succinylbenzoic acid--CoA ligase